MKKETKIMLGITAGIGALGVIYYLKNRQPVAALQPQPSIVQQPIPQLPAPKALNITDRMIKMAQDQLGLSRDDITVRSLIPSDFGLTTWNFDLSSGSNSIVSSSISDNTFIAITGISYPTVSAGNAATEVNINAGARTAEIWPIQWIPDLENPVWEDPDPTIVQQNESVGITVFATKSATGEPLIFQGVVVERRGLTIA